MADKLASGADAVQKGRYGSMTLAEIFEQMKPAVKPSTQGWLTWKYENVVNATALLDWCESQPWCADRAMGLAVCKDLQKQGAIKHVWDSNPEFRDQKMFFQYTGTEQKMPLADFYDVVVIGGGTAGLSATSFCGQFGVNVVMLEKNKVGGDCTWAGCVPSKSLIRASHILRGAVEAEQFSVTHSKPKADMKKVKEYIWDKIHYIAKHDEHILQDNNVPIRYGEAKFTDPNTLEFKSRAGNTETIKSKSFIVCLGAVAAPPPMTGLDKVKFHTYETIFDVDVLPPRMCVIGGGVIGSEIAQSYARLGSEVTLVANKLLPKEPSKVDKALSEQFEEEGIKIVRGRGVSVENVDAEGKVVKVTVKNKSGELIPIETDLLLIATGRRPFTNGIGLDLAGVEVDEKTKLIKVNDKLCTTAANIYAAGDCCTLQQFTHFASQMGLWAARNALIPGSSTPTHVVPRATFTEPEVASVGLTEAEAIAAGHEVISQSSLLNERAICESDTKGFIDVYINKKGYIVGCCIMNNRAGELLSELLVCMNHNIPFTSIGLRQVVHPYPTYSWSQMMLATTTDSKKFNESAAGSIARWYVGR